MTEEKKCPQCGEVLKVLLFLAITPDGYVCEHCHIYYSEDLKPLAHVIGEEA
jgi:ribosomal protein S27AE